MAEAVFRALTTTSSPRIRAIDSAGTGAYHTGDDPDPRTMSVLRKNHITDYTHGARRVTLQDFTAFDFILAMDSENLASLRRSRTQAAKKLGPGREHALATVALFGDYGGSEGEEVVDPYYGGDRGFDTAYEQMVRFSRGFMREVLGVEGLGKQVDQE